MLLDRVEAVFHNPFPHVVIRRALPPDLYRELAATRPSAEMIIGGREAGPNVRMDMSTKDAIAKLAPVWKTFCAYHSSKAFFDQVIDVFSEPLKRIYPKKWEAMTVGIRGDNVDVGLECQIGINTPSLVLSSVCGPHIDNEVELYAGLLYMKDDEEEGGDLEIYRWTKGHKYTHKRLCDPAHIELVKTVKYEANTFVLFLNTAEAVHGVSPRKSAKTRNLVNVIADVNSPLFDL
jgi:hypothetical protein